MLFINGKYAGEIKEVVYWHGEEWVDMLNFRALIPLCAVTQLVCPD